MGGGRNISSDLPRKVGGGSVRTARLSKKDTTNKPKRNRPGPRPSQSANARAKLNVEPLVIEEFPSVWEALGYSSQEAANLNARADLMIQIRNIIREGGWTQAAAAKRCGVSQPRINDLLRSKIGKFSIDALINMAAALGRRVNVTLEAA